MKCGVDCFADRRLKDRIEFRSKERGRCGISGTEDTALIDATDLADDFGPVCGIYEPHPAGEPLVDWLIKDWNIFSINRDQALCLLEHILDDAKRAQEPCKPQDAGTHDNLGNWESLRHELRCSNRFFPDAGIDHDHAGKLFQHLIMAQADLPTFWHRARIESESSPFSKKEMGPPPPDKTDPGRANPAGIPYLYLASTQETAIAEVRPQKGEILTVAEYSIKKQLQFIDLRNPRKSTTPFDIEDDDIVEVRQNIPFLEELGRELSAPVLPGSAVIDYIPSQYLCEFIKKLGYHGVVYNSSVFNGMNLALFDVKDIVFDNIEDDAPSTKIVTTGRYKITDVDLKHRSIPSHSGARSTPS